MGAGNFLGLLAEINLDPTKAEAAMDRFAAQSGKTMGYVQAQVREYHTAESAAYDEAVSRARGAGEQVDKALLSNVQTTRLAAQELGIHLPRAVSSGVAEMMPGISALGPALMGAFAVMEIPKIISGLREAAYWVEGFGKEAQAAFAEAVKASDDAFTHFKDLKTGISLRNEINQNIAALQTERDVLDATGGSAVNYARAVMASLSGQTAAAAVYADMARGQQLITEHLARLEKTRFEQLNRQTELEDKQHKDSAARASAEHAHALTAQHWRMEMIKAMQEAGRELERLHKQQDETAASALRMAHADLQFALTLEQFGVVGERDLSIIRQLAPVIEEDTRSLERYVAVTARAAEIVQSENAAMLESHMATMVGMIAGRKAAAVVEAVWQTAEGFAALAMIPPNFWSATQHFLSAAEYGMIAGGVGGGGGGRGGGGGASYGGGGGYGERRGGGGGEGALYPGAGPRSLGASTSIHLNFMGGAICPHCAQDIAATLTQGVKTGTLVLNANEAFKTTPRS